MVNRIALWFYPALFAGLFIMGSGNFAAAPCADVYVNPLKGSTGVHDPVMIKQDSTWYIFYTGDYIPVKASRDRMNWRELPAVFSQCPGWFKTYVPENDGKNCWAPDISFRDGKYWLYYSVSTFGSRISAIGLATTPTLDTLSATFGWTDHGMVIRSDNSKRYNCIDPNVFVDTGGKVWLVFGSWSSGIEMTELDAQSGKPVSEAPQVTSLASRANGLGIEAPFIIRKGDFHYLFVSWDNCCKGVNSTYNIRVGRSPEVTGPYTDKTGKPMTSGGGTLVDDGDERWIGPGHNAIFTENDTVFLVNHAYDAYDGGNPKLMIRPLYWDEEGWPTIDSSLGGITALHHAAAVAHRSNGRRGDTRPVVLCPHSRINGADALFSLSGRRINFARELRGAASVYIVREHPDAPRSRMDNMDGER